jgi:hypothetical protein
MTSTDWIGSISVAILLLAFILHLANWIARNSVAYSVMNLVGAGLACLASVLLNIFHSLYWRVPGQQPL